MDLHCFSYCTVEEEDSGVGIGQRQTSNRSSMNSEQNSEDYGSLKKKRNKDKKQGFLGFLR